MSLSGYTIVQVAGAFASCAAMALGPLPAAGVTALATLFDQWLAPAGPDIVTAISSALQSDLTTDDINHDLSAICTFQTWFNNYAGPGLTGSSLAATIKIPAGAAADPATAYGSFYSSLYEAVLNPSGGLLPALQDLQQSDGQTSGVNRQVQALPTFLFGASLHLTLARLYLYVSGVSRGSFSKPDLQAILDYIGGSDGTGGYIGYVNGSGTAAQPLGVNTYIQQQINTRLGLVRQATATPLLLSPGAIQGLAVIDTGSPIASNPADGSANYTLWGDNFQYSGDRGTVVCFVQDASSGIIFKDYTPQTSVIQTLMAQYLAQLTSDQDQLYYPGSSPAAVAGVVSSWQSMYQNLQALLPGATS